MGKIKWMRYGGVKVLKHEQKKRVGGNNAQAKERETEHRVLDVAVEDRCCEFGGVRCEEGNGSYAVALLS